MVLIMCRKAFSVLLLMLCSLSFLAPNVRLVRASGTIYIQGDGTVYPPTAPIQRHGDTYTFTHDVYNSIVVQRDNVVIDGNGHTVQGPVSGNGIELSGRRDVTVRNTRIYLTNSGIMLSNSSDCSITGNNLTYNSEGIWLDASSNNSICENNIANNVGDGIDLVEGCSNNTISGNNVVANSLVGLHIYDSIGNRIFHNKFDNSKQLDVDSSTNIWDDGYPSGGNYWSDYTGVDLNHDGIGDSPYVVNVNSQDNYPLTSPFLPDFSISLSSYSLSINRGEASTCTITLTSIGNFSSEMSLAASVDPSSKDVTPSFTPALLALTAGNSAQSTLTINTTPSVPLETFAVAVTATGGEITRTATLAVSVEVFASASTYHFELLDQPSSYSSQDEVRISIPSSLYNFYYDSSHYVPSDTDQAMFVTPYPFKLVADSLWKLCGNGTNSDEAFADAVLDIVHQLTYDASTHWQYAVETLVTQSGKCCTLSFLAASIMKAGGLDVVLLEYPLVPPGHVALGVKLEDNPIYVRSGYVATYVSYDYSKYWVAECTPGYYTDTGKQVPWQQGNRVGEKSNVMNGTATVIPIPDSERSPPSQVTARLTCTPTLSLQLSVFNATVGQQTAISGQLSVPFAGSIQILIRNGNTASWSALAWANMSSNGAYSYLWNLQEKGIFYVQASFEGFDDSDITLNAAQSTSQEVYVYPLQRNPMTISLEVSSKEVTVGDSVMITGKLSIPASEQVDICIRSQKYGYSWTLASVSSGLDGTYTYVWHPDTVDKYWISVNFPGNIDNCGATSSEFIINVNPPMFAVIIANAPYIGTISAIVIAVFCTFLLLRRRKSRKLQQPPPSIPPPSPSITQIALSSSVYSIKFQGEE